MARPCKKRNVCLKLKSACFVPQEYKKKEWDDVVLEVDEIEAVRLADLEGRYQEFAAKKMCISRATFSNIINRAHLKIAQALINGKAVRINCPVLAQKKTMTRGRNV